MSVNQEKRAAQAWPTLTELARQRNTITYGELANRIQTDPRAVRYFLEKIQNYCLKENLPPLTILVLNQSGTQGSGFIAWDTRNAESGLERVYSHPWKNVRNPFHFASDGSSVESISSDIVNGVIAPYDAYTRINDRGMAQTIFRRSLLKAYEKRCAISGYTSPLLLEAAHIIPWSAANEYERLDPTNGILLSVLHHRLFDAGLITVGEDYVIQEHSEKKKIKKNTPEYSVLKELNGKKLSLPQNQRHWPNRTFLERRLKLKT